MATLPHCSGSATEVRRSGRNPALPYVTMSSSPDTPMPIALDLDAAIAYSRYATAALGARPHERDVLARTLDAPFDWAPAEASLDAIVDAGEPRALADAVRRLRRNVFLHTLARDLTARADLREVCAAMTTLAETTLRSALSLHHPALAADFGEPRGEQGDAQELVIVGMGKLGGARAQRVVRHRSRVRLPGRRRDGRRADARQSRILRAPRPTRHRRAARDHAGRLRLSRGREAPSLRRKRAARRALRPHSSSTSSRRGARGSATRGSRRAR